MVNALETARAVAIDPHRFSLHIKWYYLMIGLRCCDAACGASPSAERAPGVREMVQLHLECTRFNLLHIACAPASPMRRFEMHARDGRDLT